MTDTISGIRSKKIITICRRLYGDDLLRLAEALHKAGICHMEVTFDQSDSAGEEKTVRAPISHVFLLATGGITEDNFGDFLAAGAVGAGISGRLTDKKCIEAGNFEELTHRARAFMDIAGRY